MAERQAERAGLKEVVNDTKEIESLRRLRRVRRFSDFPDFTKNVYQNIAGCFPGIQVYACGSRVRGDYIDWLTLDNTPSLSQMLVESAREKAGMKKKFDSDYDYWAAPEFQPVSKPPINTDRCRLRIPEKEKIPLPMWDFSKLPESEHENVKALLAKNDIQGLVKIHDRYKLSEYSYCCSGIEGVRNWFTWAIEQGIIK